MQGVLAFADVALREAAEGMSARDLVKTVDGEGNAFIAELLLSFVVRFAVTAATDDTADADEFTDGEALDFFSEGGDMT